MTAIPYALFSFAGSALGALVGGFWGGLLGCIVGVLLCGEIVRRARRGVIVDRREMDAPYSPHPLARNKRRGLT